MNQQPTHSSQDLNKIPNNNSNQDEVDLGQIIVLLRKGIKRIQNLIESIVKSILMIFVYVCKAFLDNIKLIVISLLVAIVLGVTVEKLTRKIYSSQMLVKPYFESKFQLITNINYYNALIDDKDFDRLSEIFGISKERSKELKEFEIKPGPETENDRILQYENFISQIDSLRKEDITYQDFIENRGIYSGELYEIKVKSTNKNIFNLLETGLNSTFSNEYSKNKMKKRDSLIVIEKERIMQSLVQIDSLKKVYIEVLKTESTSNKGSISIKEGNTLVQERINTKEYELLSKEMELRQELTRLSAQQIETDDYFDVVSSFQEKGSVFKSIWRKYSLLFPAAVFSLLTIGFFTKRIISFVRKFDLNTV